jgi:hypothetical protein
MGGPAVPPPRTSQERAGANPTTAFCSRRRETLGEIETASPISGLAVVDSLARRPEPRGFGYRRAASTINDLTPEWLTSV